MKRLMTALMLSLVMAGGNQLYGNDKREVAFGSLEAMSVADARDQASAWLASVGKTDAASKQRFEAIWKQEDRSVLDLVAEMLALGNADAAKLLADARNPDMPAPTQVPAILKDAKQALFFRANLGLAYARYLSNRRIHEETLEVLKVFRPEQVVDPIAYLFHRSVAEHALLNKTAATQTIVRLLDDGVGAPERYKTLSALMLLDIQTWKDKDLGSIARKMENIERRLDLARGGPQTQKQQKEVIARLDELIKELENKAKKKPGSGSGGGNGGGCPDSPGSGPPNGGTPSSPATESGIANNGGPGHVDPVKMKKLVEQWGRMQPREQARALQDLTQGMSRRHQEAIENYFRNLAQASSKR